MSFPEQPNCGILLKFSSKYKGKVFDGRTPEWSRSAFNIWLAHGQFYYTFCIFFPAIWLGLVHETSRPMHFHEELASRISLWWAQTVQEAHDEYFNHSKICIWVVPQQIPGAREGRAQKSYSHIPTNAVGPELLDGKIRNLFTVLWTRVPKT